MTSKTMKVQLRRDTASNWTTKNPVLLSGEMGIESDTNKFKFGDGNKTWTQLDYASAGSGGLTPENTIFTDSAFEISDNNGNVALQIDKNGNIKTKNFDSSNKNTGKEYDIEYALRNGSWGQDACTWHPNYVCNYTRIKGPFKVSIGQGYILYNAWKYNSQNEEDFTGAEQILENSLNRLSFEYTGTDYVGLNIISSNGIGSELTVLEPLYQAINSLKSPEITENKKKEDKVKAIRNAIFLGDSITHGVYSYYKDNKTQDEWRYCSWYWNRTYKTMPDYFSEYSGACVNNAAGRGSGYVIQGRYDASGNNVSGRGPFYGNMMYKIQQYDFINYDFVGIFQGINDYLQQASLGTFPTSGNPVEGTVTGNLALSIQKIINDNPLCKIVVYSPYNSWGQVAKGDASTGGYVANETYGNFAGDYALGYNKGTYTLSQLIEAIDKVCKYYHIEHIKLSESNICNRLSIKNIMIEGLHSSLESMPKLAAEIFADKGYGE